MVSAGPLEREDEEELYSVEHVQTRLGACQVHPIPALLVVRRCSLFQVHRCFWRLKNLSHTSNSRHHTGECEIGHLLILPLIISFVCVLSQISSSLPVMKSTDRQWGVLVSAHVLQMPQLSLCNRTFFFQTPGPQRPHPPYWSSKMASADLMRARCVPPLDDDDDDAYFSPCFLAFSVKKGNICMDGLNYKSNTLYFVVNFCRYRGWT